MFVSYPAIQKPKRIDPGPFSYVLLYRCFGLYRPIKASIQSWKKAREIQAKGYSHQAKVWLPQMELPFFKDNEMKESQGTTRDGEMSQFES